MEPDAPSTARFHDRAEDYARYRPGYPAAVVDAMVAGWASLKEKVAADIGAGTGISSRLLADRGLGVIAVEPNAAMRQVAVPHPRVRWVEGTAEATGLAEGTVDLVLAAQAFHWFTRAAALAEFQRILRPGGRLAIMWNRRSRKDPFTLGYRNALEAIDGEAPAERSVFEPEVVTASGRFVNLRATSVTNMHPLTLDELLGRARSTSTVPKSGPVFEELQRLLRQLHGEHRAVDGRATMVYDTQVFVWDCAPRP
jgi:SAM-dependent methyltransferase